jgi:RimJ/RimL family protein N-acetyltransferase
MTTLRGQRLVLRDLETNDWPAVHAYSARLDVVQYQPWGPNTPDDSRAFVAQVVAAAKEVPRMIYALAITRGDSDQCCIGTATLHVHSLDHGQGEIGYFLHPEVWGRGYATEAARLLLTFGFADLGLHRIYGTCDPRNAPSARVLQKAGMSYEGLLRHTMRLRDGWRDSAVYSILVHEWQAT